jgi:hypothetical protein
MNLEEQNLNEPQNPQLNIGAVMCCFFGHKYRLKRHITPYLREIKCTRCKQEFGMNDQTQSVLLLDDELIELHRVLK